MNPTREHDLGTPASNREETVEIEIDGLPARVKAGSTIISQRVLYGNTYNLFKKIAPQYDINVVYVEGSDLDEWQAAFAKHPDAVLAYLETPANPTMQVVDIKGVARVAHASRGEAQR